mgnify:CR=1 FL=1
MSPLLIPSPSPRSNVILADDTAVLRRPKRAWQDEHRGVIEDRESFNEYPWPDLTDIQETYMLIYDVMRKELPEGMMIIPLTSLHFKEVSQNNLVYINSPSIT